MATKRNSLRSKRIARSLPRQRGLPSAEREYQQVVREIEGSPLPDMNWSTQSPPTPVQRVRQTRYNQARPAPVPVIRKGLQALERAVPQIRQAEAVPQILKPVGNVLRQAIQEASKVKGSSLNPVELQAIYKQVQGAQGITPKLQTWRNVRTGAPTKVDQSEVKRMVTGLYDGDEGHGLKQNYGTQASVKASIADTKSQLAALKKQTWDKADQSLYGTKGDFTVSKSMRMNRLTKAIEYQESLLSQGSQSKNIQSGMEFLNPVIKTGTSTAKKADDFVRTPDGSEYKILAQSPTGTQVIQTSKKATGKISATSVETKKRNYLQRRFDGRIPFVNRPWSAMTRGDKLKIGGFGGITMFYGGATIGSSIRPDPFTPMRDATGRTRRPDPFTPELTRQTPYTGYTDPMTLTPPSKGTITHTMTPIQAQIPMQSSMTQAPQKTYPKGIFWSEEHGSYVKKIGTYKKDDPLAGVKKGDPKFSFIKGVGKKTEAQLAQTGKIRIRDPLTGKTKSYTKAEIKELNQQQRQRQAEMLLTPEFAYRQAMGERDRMQGQQIRGMGAIQDWEQSLPKGMDPARVYEFYGGKGNPLA